MSIQKAASSHSRAGSRPCIKDDCHAGESEFSAFDLRDTLRAITVHEVNFSEFRSALKSFSLLAERRTA